MRAGVESCVPLVAAIPDESRRFREVDDEVRRERVEKAARRYGVIVGVIVLLALIAFGGTLWWRSHQQDIAGEKGENRTVLPKVHENFSRSRTRQGDDQDQHQPKASQTESFADFLHLGHREIMEASNQRFLVPVRNAGSRWSA